MPTSERALKAAEEVRSLAMNYFGYATATGDTNEVYQKFPVTRVAAIIDAEFPAGDRRKGERREGSSSGADKDYCLADGSYRRKSERRLDHQLSPSPCGVKGHCTKDWTGRRNSERRINNHCCNGGTIHCLELHPSRVGCRRNFPRRITNLGGYCRRCKEINRACAEAELSEAERQGERIEKAVTAALEAAGQYIPGDLRALGWSVAIHNDYRQDGKFHTFWLLTKGGQCVKGEGESDAEALNQIRVAIRGKGVKG